MGSARALAQAKRGRNTQDLLGACVLECGGAPPLGKNADVAPSCRPML